MEEFEVKVSLTVVGGKESGRSIPIEKKRTTLGRKKADISLNDTKVSGEHATITIDGDRVVITDLHSRNGVFVNGEKVMTAQLRNLDEIQLGLTKLKVLVVENLELFKKRNVNPPKKDLPKEGDISSLIDDELKSFSRWDLAQSDSEEISSSFKSKINYILEVVEGNEEGMKFRLEHEITTIGRGEADLVIEDPDVSRIHAVIEITPQGVAVIRDQNSTNGVLVNSEKVQETPLARDDRIQLGSTVLRFMEDP